MKVGAKFEVKGASRDDAARMLMPLHGETSTAIGTDLNQSGFGKCCAACCKPFNRARKQRAVGRIRHFDPVSGLLTATNWLLCGRCAHEIRHNGTRMPAALVEEARSAASAGILMSSPAKGNA